MVASTIANHAWGQTKYRPPSEFLLKFQEPTVAAPPAKPSPADVELLLRGGFARIMAAQSAGRPPTTPPTK